MHSLTEGDLTFGFQSTWHVTKYDDWSFYRNQFQKLCGGSKAVDFLAFDPSDGLLWMIEVKDYRANRRAEEKGDLVMEIAYKMRDTLAGLMVARHHACGDEQAFAKRALTCNRLRVALHLEQPKETSKLFPRAFNPANIQQKLKQLVKPIDPHPRVYERGMSVDWTVT